MKISANHLRRYKQIAVLLWKYGRSDLVHQMGIAQDEGDDAPAQQAGAANPQQLADDLEAMGPTFVKLGQVLASRPDLLPEPYLQALGRLHDNVKPFSFAEVEEIVASELNVRISKAFSRFDTAPMAAASLGQVHFAALRDGREVVVKVQRPNIAKQITEDFEILAQMAEFLEAHTEFGRRRRLLDMLEEFRLTIKHELNYEREAQNLISMGENMAEFKLITVPQPVGDYSTRRVLTMDYVRGSKITKVGPVARLELDGEALAEELFKAYLKQVLVDGLFHADPHPGNVFLTSDRRIALLDLGMVGHVTPGMQESLLHVLIAISEGKGDDAAKAIVAVSETTEDFDAGAFKRRIAQLLVERQDQGLQQMSVGKTLLAVTQTAANAGLFVPSDLALLGKTLLQLDEVGRILDPDFDPNAAIRREITNITAQHLHKGATKGSVMNSLLEMKDFVAGLPSKVNRIMDALANHELEVKVKAVDANLVMEGLQKIANRITTGIILAALIVGASLLMRVETSFHLMGYPGLAILCFLGAAGGGIWLLINIFVSDQKRKSRPARQ
ncbi:MAG: AarF/ABC1/UbiB kinase family protein [Prolixibacteraceae bacterium]|nr:AarF/ABC1/UbiB kinase family protein [Burkholderiales bacterium]